MKKNALKFLMSFILTINTLIVPVYAGEAKFSSFKDIQEYLYDNFKDRNSEINFIYTGSEKNFKNSILEVIRQAYSEDDYTARAWSEIKPNLEKSDNGINVSLKVSYITTKEEEIYVDNEIKNILSKLIGPNMTDIEKVKAINDYLASIYDYDYSLSSNNPYTALTTGKTVCQGYSMTAYKMLTDAGIKNKIIVGTLNGGSHSWNSVLINNKWYNLDVTNNDSTKSHKYFLVDDNILKENKYLWYGSIN